MPKSDIQNIFQRSQDKISNFEMKLLQRLNGTKPERIQRISDQQTSTWILDMANNAQLVNFGNYGTGGMYAHAIWYMKTGDSGEDWSLFDPVGRQQLEGFLNDRLLKINIKNAVGGAVGRGGRASRGGVECSPAEIIGDPRRRRRGHIYLSPETSINRGSDRDNPGFCGIFGIGMASYALWARQRFGAFTNECVEKWKLFMEIASMDPDKREGVAIQFGQYILEEIAKGTDFDTIVNAIAGLVEYNANVYEDELHKETVASQPPAKRTRYGFK